MLKLSELKNKATPASVGFRRWVLRGLRYLSTAQGRFDMLSSDAFFPAVQNSSAEEGMLFLCYYYKERGDYVRTFKMANGLLDYTGTVRSRRFLASFARPCVTRVLFLEVRSHPLLAAQRSRCLTSLLKGLRVHSDVLYRLFVLYTLACALCASACVYLCPPWFSHMLAASSCLRRSSLSSFFFKASVSFRLPSCMLVCVTRCLLMLSTCVCTEHTVSVFFNSHLCSAHESSPRSQEKKPSPYCEKCGASWRPGNTSPRSTRLRRFP